MITVVRQISRVVRWHFFTFLGRLRKGKFSDEGLRISEKADWGHVAVLGRGRSARLIELSEEHYDHVLLCNYRDEELRESGFLDYVSKQKLIVLSNIEEPVFSSRILRRLNVVGLVWAGFLDGRLPGRKRVVGRLNRVGQKVSGLPPDFEIAIYQIAQNTGNIGVALAALRSSRVDVFGIEFYTTDYIRGPSEKRAMSELELLQQGTKLHDAFEELLEAFPRTYFTHWCLTDHKFVKANLNSQVVSLSAPFQG